MTLMTDRPTDLEPTNVRSRRSPARAIGPALRRFGAAVTLLPRSVAQLVRVTGGRVPEEMTRRGALVHAVVGMLLGLVGLVLLGLVGLFVARGLLYGFVVSGPYDTSWGGPTKAGAWIVHSLISFPAAVGAVLAGGLVMLLHRQVTDRFRGRPAPAWTVPATVAVCAGVTLFVIAWTRQI